MFIGFGNPVEWKAFHNAHPVFVEKVPLLFKTFHKVFKRKVPASAPRADALVLHLGMLCVEDFKEILVLCANGFGIGGQKILRGLYEKTITADYLSTHPDEAIKFLDYFWVHLKKDLNHLKLVYKRDIHEPGFTENVMKEYEKVKDQFIEPLCKNCGTTKPQMSWTRLNVEAMGKAAKSPMADWYHTCYFLPTMQTHTTMGAIFSRLKIQEELDFAYFSTEPTRNEASKVARNSHLLMLNVLHRQNQHFDLDMEDEIMERARELNESWDLPETSES